MSTVAPVNNEPANYVPLRLKVNKSGQLYAAFPTNGPNGWDHLHLNHCFLAQVVQCLAWLGYLYLSMCALESSLIETAFCDK
jgi:hypothetical protein